MCLYQQWPQTSLWQTWYIDYLAGGRLTLLYFSLFIRVWIKQNTTNCSQITQEAIEIVDSQFRINSRLTPTSNVVYLHWEYARRQIQWCHDIRVLILHLEDVVSLLCCFWPGNLWALLVELNSSLKNWFKQQGKVVLTYSLFRQLFKYQEIINPKQIVILFIRKMVKQTKIILSINRNI